MATALHLAALAAVRGAAPDFEQGDLSLALAGAELIDLADLHAVVLMRDRIMPAAAPRTENSMLIEAAAEIVRDAPHETVERWLWRRGRDLAARYRVALRATVPEPLARAHRQRLRQAAPAVGPHVLCSATDRLMVGDPVLTHLAAAAGIAEPPPADALDGLDEDEIAVLADVHQAITQLAAERQRRWVDRGGFDNLWRGF
ncbi:GPP34 family phosphoprotein [Streptomyces pseudogriseolus]|uniref:GPP34 family phosphoprotein n=1 Tax=Streptomyces pseudogriseolus TaxID=36817 RepID=UPI001CE33F0F|nr:GPP34 family phosphoprotein [Streptomyces pseudogriseolus]